MICVTVEIFPIRYCLANLAVFPAFYRWNRFHCAPAYHAKDQGLIRSGDSIIRGRTF